MLTLTIGMRRGEILALLLKDKTVLSANRQTMVDNLIHKYMTLKKRGRLDASWTSLM